jgi:hypothetical protein
MGVQALSDALLGRQHRRLHEIPIQIVLALRAEQDRRDPVGICGPAPGTPLTIPKKGHTPENVIVLRRTEGGVMSFARIAAIVAVASLLWGSSANAAGSIRAFKPVFGPEAPTPTSAPATLPIVPPALPTTAGSTCSSWSPANIVGGLGSSIHDGHLLQTRRCRSSCDSTEDLAWLRPLRFPAV